MVESQGRKGNVGSDVKPSDGGRIALWGELVAVAGDESDVEDGNGVAARIAPGSANGSDLFEKDPCDAGFFSEFTEGGGVEVLVRADESAGQGPGAAEGLLSPFDEEDAKAKIVERARDREQDGVHRDGRTGPRVAILP